MRTVSLDLGRGGLELHLPDSADILTMQPAKVLDHPAAAIAAALQNPVATPPLARIIEEKVRTNPRACAVIVVSDCTRPVPYAGDGGILWPIVKVLLDHGVTPDRVLILVATGTHRPMTDAELRRMLDPRVFEHGIPIVNHECRDTANLARLGTTARGSEVLVNRRYIDADIKILTGLVESHIMAGASGGRKAICPGLVGEQTTFVFHSAEILSSPRAVDLVFEGNPCHEESLEIARKAGCADFIVNVTLDRFFRITGVFAGDMELAHAKAVEKLREYVAIPVDKTYDAVVTHGGLVGINHYQANKGVLPALPIVNYHARIIAIADCTDQDPIGGPLYREALKPLTATDAGRYLSLIRSRKWTFIPEQWAVQMWARVFAKVPAEKFVYFAPQMKEADYALVPGVDGNVFLPAGRRYRNDLSDAPAVIEGALDRAVRDLAAEGVRDPAIAFLADGPYGIPVSRDRQL